MGAFGSTQRIDVPDFRLLQLKFVALLQAPDM
jgi:hypothetical protein